MGVPEVVVVDVVLVDEEVEVEVEVEDVVVEVLADDQAVLEAPPNSTRSPLPS
jgi:hypothetical protein